MELPMTSDATQCKVPEVLNIPDQVFAISCDWAECFIRQPGH